MRCCVCPDNSSSHILVCIQCSIYNICYKNQVIAFYKGSLCKTLVPIIVEIINNLAVCLSTRLCRWYEATRSFANLIFMHIISLIVAESFLKAERMKITNLTQYSTPLLSFEVILTKKKMLNRDISHYFSNPLN